MADSRLLAELRETLENSTVDEYINKIADQDNVLTSKVITQLLKEENENTTWLLVNTAWQNLQELTQKLANWDQAVTPIIYEEAIQKVAAALEAVTVDSKSLVKAQLLAYTFQGLNKRNISLDSLTRWGGGLKNTLMKRFNGKNREENFMPVLAAIEVLNTKIKKIIDTTTQPEPVVNNEDPLPTAVLKQTEPSIQESTEKTKPPFSEDDLNKIIESLALKLLRYKTIYESSQTEIRSFDPKIGAAEQIESLCENLNLIKEATTINLTLAEGVNSSFQHFLKTYEEDRKYKRLAALEQEIEAKINEEKVIPYDEQLAIECQLSRDQKDAWRQHSYINYESTLSLKSMYNRMRETAGLVHSTPVLGSLSHLLSGAARHLPGSQTVMGSQTDYKQVMAVLKNSVTVAKNEKISYLTNLQKAFADSCDIGRKLVEQTDGLLSASRRILTQLQSQEEKLEKPEELNQKIEDLKTAVNTYIKTNDGLIRRLARKVFGVGADEFKIVTELKTLLEESEAITDIEKLRTILDQKTITLSKQKKNSQLVDLIRSLR